MAQLQVAVPSGCQAGQSLEFTPPGYSQPLSVVMAQQVAPGSVVTVQYPVQQQRPVPVMPNPGLPGVSPQTLTMQQRALPPVNASLAEEDRRGCYLGWGLYGVGCLCLLLLPILGCVLWVVAASLYYCKPANHRAHLLQTRMAALTALITCVASCCCLIVASVAMAAMLASCATTHADGTVTFENCEYIDNFSTPKPWNPDPWPKPTGYPVYTTYFPTFTTWAPAENAADVLVVDQPATDESVHV